MIWPSNHVCSAGNVTVSVSDGDCCRWYDQHLQRACRHDHPNHFQAKQSFETSLLLTTTLYLPTKPRKKSHHLRLRNGVESFLPNSMNNIWNGLLNFLHAACFARQEPCFPVWLADNDELLLTSCHSNISAVTLSRALPLNENGLRQQKQHELKWVCINCDGDDTEYILVPTIQECMKINLPVWNHPETIFRAVPWFLHSWIVEIPSTQQRFIQINQSTTFVWHFLHTGCWERRTKTTRFEETDRVSIERAKSSWS